MFVDTPGNMEKKYVAELGRCGAQASNPCYDFWMGRATDRDYKSLGDMNIPVKYWGLWER